MTCSWSKASVFGWMALASIAPAPAVAQNMLEPIKALYESAKYEDALALLPASERGRRPEVEQYRVFCLVALGRTAEAEQAVASVVAAAPSFAPAETEAPPRIQEMFTRARRQLVPVIAQRWYREARDLFDRQQKTAAEAQFVSLVQLIDGFIESAGGEDQPMLSELRLLASGFLDLSRSTAARAPSPAPPSEEATPSRGPATPPVSVMPPVARRQQMPAWAPSDAMSRQGAFAGAVRVRISTEGKVTAATIERSVHPSYDRELLRAAQGWVYSPATRDGVPVPSEQLVQVQLKPRQ